MNVITKSVALPDGREITIETGKLARQADGAVVVRLGNTMLLATVVAKQEANEGVDFLPMSVDYQEKFASAGKIPGGFLKREGRLSEHEILTCRLVDRALRPLFPDDFHAETQVNISMVSADEAAPPDALAALAASSALLVSDIPFGGPISEVRVGRVDGKIIVNPTTEQMEASDVDMIIAASASDIMMVEGEMAEISEDEMLECLKEAHEAIKAQCAVQKELEAAVGKTKKREYNHEVNDENVYNSIKEELYQKFYDVYASKNPNKSERSEQLSAIKQEYLEAHAEDEHDPYMVNRYIGKISKEAARKMVLDQKSRMDGRETTEIRPIWSEVDYLPGTHGSALFTRGETQSLTSVTLGTKLDEQMIDNAMEKSFSKFILHYNFPAFSTGEVRPNRGPGRREIGHGNLAHRALKAVLPDEEENPYTIRVVSDILESNGSSSMATVCAGCLALMDSGIQVKSMVSGIAMGMISDPETGDYAILSDILGDEDHLGDMDFKTTGTEKGITACQMDIKIDGLSFDRLKEALLQAKEGRAHILGEMKKTMTESRAELKPHTPRSVRVVIDKELIGAVIGPGGKVVQEIQNTTGATVTIEEVDGKGHVSIFASDAEVLEAALGRVKAITQVPEVGEVYDGTVKSIMPFGAFVEFIPGKEGLLHISEIKWERLESMDGVLEEGEQVKIKLVAIDKKTGKFRLSRKVLLPDPRKQKEDKE